MIKQKSSVLTVDTKDLINTLEQRSSYPHPTSKIQTVITGASVVFLTGEFVYKINKPVNFGFLDFSTLEKRKEQCEKEFNHNSLLSPSIYIGVSTLNLSKDGSLKIDTPGEIVEYAVKMKQMDPNSTMDKLLKENKVTRHHIHELAQKIHAYHQIAPAGEEVQQFGSLQSIQFNWDENFSQTESYIGPMISKDQFTNLKKKIKNFIEENKELFHDRVKKGNIKHCHGDFHSQNIFITKDQSHIFDGIVFNKRFPCSDVIAEVAFMAMDLDYHGKEELSYALTEKYREITADPDIYRLIDFYKCYRAYIRAKINCFTYDDPNLTPEKKQEVFYQAKAYFDLAEHYAHLL